MEYTAHQLAKLAGVSTRTLRYYDEINLLKPVRKASTGYRIYGPQQIDRLQQILFYKQMGFELANIQTILSAPNFDAVKAMENHLQNLQQQQEKIKTLIETVNQTLKSLKGEIIMNDAEKFKAFKEQKIQENEQKYGQEARAKYGDAAVDASNQKLKEATPAQYTQAQELSLQINENLKQAVLQGDPHNEIAQKTCKLHQQWISFYWGSYSKEAHLGLCQMYTQDERFQAYYEEIAPGATQFLLKAMEFYLQDKN